MVVLWPILWLLPQAVVAKSSRKTEKFLDELVGSSLYEASQDFPLSAFANAREHAMLNFSLAAAAALKITQKRRGQEIGGKLPPSLCPFEKLRCALKPYRQLDGWCTNQWDPHAGAEFAPFDRQISANYEDGISKIAFYSSGKHLPPTSAVADIFKSAPKESTPLTRLFIEFTDFVFRDLVQLVRLPDAISCCRTRSEECFEETHGKCFIRSSPTPSAGCIFGSRQQMNAATAFLDAGLVYPPASVEFDEHGKLPTSSIGRSVFESLFVDEHNWAVEELRAANPQLGSRRLFEEARKFVVAQLQHITFAEWLPLLLGEETMAKYELKLGSRRVDKAVHVNTLNEFGAGAGQFYKFMFAESLGSAIDVNWNIQELLTSGSWRPGLHDGGDETIAASQNDAAFLLAVGRDHGIGTYAQWRHECRGGKLKSFDDLHDQIFDFRRIVDGLRHLYSSVKDVDLLVLALAEKPVYGALLGPTLGCILGLQFRKTKLGDGFWFEDYLNEAQLAQVQKTTAAGLICRHAKVSKVQRNTFVLPDMFTNLPVSCNSSAFPKINFEDWVDISISASSGERFFLPSIRMRVCKGVHDFRYEDILGQCVRRVNRQRSRSSDNFDKNLSGTFLHSYGRMMLAKDEAVVEANISFILLQATKQLLAEHHQTLADVQGVVLGDSLRVGLKVDCIPRPLPCDPTSPYRTYTGWCNNLANPDFANTFTELKRILPPVYDDGIEAPRMKSSNDGILPSPRAISNAVHVAAPLESIKYSHFLMEMGQFIDHDITHSPIDQNPDGTPLNCSRCDSATTVSPSCLPIPVPPDDPFFTDAAFGPTCLAFVRSLPGQKTLGYRNQMNQVSSFLDGSVIYGSTECEGRRLRQFEGGLLKSSRLSGYSHLGITLPPSDETEQDGCRSAPRFPCFIAGDDRNSQNALLIAIQTIFHREHERLARKLHGLNSHWDDERLYQETRRIVSAEFAHVVFNEYLPKIIGHAMMDQYNIFPSSHGYFQGYNAACDASILQPFATAAFRFGHSTVTRFTPIIEGSDGLVSNVVDLATELLDMADVYADNSIEGILRGMSFKRQMRTDRHVDDAVRNSLFAEKGKPKSGLDLPAINIQRGREHGIPPYNQYREACGLAPMTSFHSLFDDMSQETLAALGAVYESPDDVDLFTGVISEKNVAGGIVGPTAACLIGEQFRRLKQCDRFFYENPHEHTKFTSDQLNQIRKATMASLICANARVKRVPKDVFSIPDEFLNADVECSTFSQLDITKWADTNTCEHRGTTIKRHSTAQISPCTSCTCTSNGLKCANVNVDCAWAAANFHREAFEKDPPCLLRCAAYLF